MTRTNPLHLVVLFVFGGALAWLLETTLAASGRAVLIPPFTLAVSLVIVGVLVVMMALPVRRVARRIPGATVDPFYATRVVIIAKASSLAGALLVGAGLGIGFYVLSRPVLQPVGSITMAFAAALGAVVLLVAGLVAEYMCTIPPDEPDQTQDVMP